MPLSRLPLCLVALAGLVSLSFAQTGPFRDGELLVRAPDANNDYTIWRIDAGTGHGAALTSGLGSSYRGPGWIAYDPFRDGLLVFTTRVQDSLYQPHLYLVRSDGTVTDLGFTSAWVRSLAPTGDGRVYMRLGGVLTVMDATNQIQSVLDENGQPFSPEVDHLLFDPASNALIGATGDASVVPCGAFTSVSVHRWSLNAAGTALSSPATCITHFHGMVAAAVGLDHLPGGDVLLTLTDGSPYAEGQMLRVDPVTLAVSTFSDTTLSDIDGGVWCQRIGRVVVLEDFANELRTFGPGQGGTGTLLPVDVPVGDFYSGWGPTENISDIDLLGPGCGGLAFGFGVGLAGTGGATPTLGAGTCPQIGTTVVMSIANGLGGAFGLLVGGHGSSPYALVGGTGYVLPPLDLQLVFHANGVGAGAGEAQVPLAVPNDPILIGLPFYFQAGLLDPIAPANVSLTPGLEIRLG